MARIRRECLQVEGFEDGFIIADYTKEENIWYRGISNNWIEGHPFVEDPFETEEEAQAVLEEI